MNTPAFVLQPFVAAFGALSVATAGLLARSRKRMHQKTAELSAAKRIIDQITHEQWVLLSETSKALSATLDYHQTLLKMSELAVPSLADYCVVDLLEEDGSVHRVRSRSEALPAEEYIRLEDPAHPIAQIISQGQAQVFGEIPEPLLKALGGSTSQLGAVRRLGLTSAMVVPMVSPRGVMGAITFALARSGRRYSNSDLDLARQLAARAALAVDHARLYRKEQLAVKSRDQLLAIVSHELKNPLTAIGLQAQLLLQHEENSKKASRLDAIRSSAHHMQQIINDLLDLDQIEAGRISLNRTPVDASRLIREPLDMLLPLAQSKNILLAAELPAESYVVSADPLRISQVVANLIGNAIKFTPEQGRVSVSTRVTGAFAEFTVADTGSGIPDENLAHVFDRYWRDSKTAHLGSGLGLSVAKGIVELHGGKIGIESTLGKSTTVRFTIPLAEPEPRGRCGSDPRSSR